MNSWLVDGEDNEESFGLSVSGSGFHKKDHNKLKIFNPKTQTYNVKQFNYNIDQMPRSGFEQLFVVAFLQFDVFPQNVLTGHF